MPNKYNHSHLRTLEIAHHEAAHAVFHLKLGLKQGRVTIKPEPGNLGHAELRRPSWINCQAATPREELRLRVHAESEIFALYAGRIAEQKFAGRRIKWGHESDYGQIADLVLSFVSHWADVQSAFSRYCEKQAKLFVEAWWPEIQAVAHALAERETLRPGQVLEIIAAIPLETLEANRGRLYKQYEEEQERLRVAYGKKDVTLPED